MNFYNLIKVGEKFLAKKNILRPRYESILLFSKVNQINLNDYYINKKKKFQKQRLIFF